MAVTVSQTKTGTASSTGSFTAGSGHFIVLLVNQTGATTQPSMAGYTLLTTSPFPAVYSSSVSSVWAFNRATDGSETVAAPTAGSGGTLAGVAMIEIAGLGASPTFGVPVVNNNLASTGNNTGSFTSVNSNSIIIVATGGVGAMASIAWDSTAPGLTAFAAGTSTAIQGAYSIPGSTITARTYTPNTLGTGRNHANFVFEIQPTAAAGTNTGFFEVM